MIPMVPATPPQTNFFDVCSRALTSSFMAEKKGKLSSIHIHLMQSRVSSLLDCNRWRCKSNTLQISNTQSADVFMFLLITPAGIRLVGSIPNASTVFSRLAVLYRQHVTINPPSYPMTLLLHSGTVYESFHPRPTTRAFNIKLWVALYL